MSFVLCCVDGENYSQSACDYAVLISNNMNLPLKFLNIVEHSSKSDTLDLSGNIKLGEKDDILQQSAQEEAVRSKLAIKEGKELLVSLKKRALISCTNEITLIQMHGDVLENILALQEKIAVLIIGIKSHENHKIGDNVKDIIREIKKPVLLVNSDFVRIDLCSLKVGGATGKVLSFLGILLVFFELISPRRLLIKILHSTVV